MLHSMPAVGGRGEETGLNPVQLPLLCLQESVVEAESSHSGRPGEGMAAGVGIGIPQCMSLKTGALVIPPDRDGLGAKFSYGFPQNAGRGRHWSATPFPFFHGACGMV